MSGPALLPTLEPLISRLEKLTFKPSRLVLEGKHYEWMHYKFSFPLNLPLLSLSSHLVYPKLLWHEKETGASSIHFGSTLSFSHIPFFGKQHKAAPLDFFYIQDFNKRKTHLWSDFPSKLCFLPLISFHQTFFLSRAGTALFKGNFFSEKDIKRAIAILKSLGSLSLTPPPTPLSKKYLPSQGAWSAQITRAKAQIEKGSYEKIVLSRLASLQFEKKLDPYATFTRLLMHQEKGTAFCFQPAGSIAFLGVTPETLYKRLGQNLTTMALAATIARGKTQEDDDKLAYTLLHSKKERREFDVVRKGLHETLKPFSLQEGRAPDNISVLKTAHVQHLFTPIHKTLIEGVDDTKLLQALHPTAAICGWPKHKTLSDIFKTEQFDRGYFSAPFGFVSPSQTQLHVAIRSGLITGNTLHLFSGAGINEGSQAVKEWDELEAKLLPFLSTFKRSEPHAKL